MAIQKTLKGDKPFPMERHFKKIDQICLVVKDLQKTIEQYWENLGIGPWKIYLFEEPLLREMTIKGRPATYRMHVAICQLENISIEVIQPIFGETIYKEFLEQRGEGLHHIGFIIQNLDEEIKSFEAKGLNPIQTGRFQGGGFAYFDSQERFGTILELIEKSHPPNIPIRVWPEDVDP